MRKILLLRLVSAFAFFGNAQRANAVAFGAILAVTSCCFSIASAQTPKPIGAPEAAPHSNLVSSGQWMAELGEQASPVQSAIYGGMPIVQEPVMFNDYGPQVAGPCDAGCDISWYVNVDALWMTRDGDDRFSLSRNNFMPDFEHEVGTRFTVGRLLDCVNGWEATYVGPFDWERQFIVTGNANLQSNLSTPIGGGYAPSDISAFNSADVHSQNYRAKMNSFEVNRRWWTWDVLSTMIGVRYINYEEDYIFRSSDSTDGIGLLVEELDNGLLGAQIGGDILFPVSLRANVGLRGKAGVYANFSERSTFLSNGGNLLLNAGDSEVGVAGQFEMGIFANYQIVPSIRLTAGYEAWYLPQMATVTGQNPASITTSNGTFVSTDEDLFLHGGSFGIQVLF